MASPTASEKALKRAYKALDEIDVALVELESNCCRPGRSPSMKALGETIAAARAGVDSVADGHDHDALDTTIVQIDDAGAQIGRLQVGCCTPSRLPLYHTLLEGLTTTQRSIKRVAGAGH